MSDPASMGSPATVNLFQIAYSQATLDAIEPGYAVLDNLDNPRPDWYEYWPIRKFLASTTLDENAFYGFFSPKFGAKTLRSHADVVRFVQEAAPRADVVLFSPQPDMAAFFLNVFEQADAFDPGQTAAFEEFLRQFGRPIALTSLVMDSRQIVFSNYFVARPSFWRAWSTLAEAFFDVCEGPATELQKSLTVPTTYNGAQRKVFLSERIAPLLLTVEPHWRTVAADPYNMGWSMSRLRQYPQEAVICDALKIAFRDQAFPEFMVAFTKLRSHFIAGKPPLD
jgi:hypothetical protein